MKPKSLASGAMIAALYAVLTFAMAPISYGPVQFRISEALTLLPWYLPEAVPGLFIGCVVANFFGGYGMVDMFFGSLATLIGALLTRKAPQLWAAALPPVVSNMIIIGAMLHVLIGVPLIATALYVGVGEAGACFLVGIPVMKLLERRGILIPTRHTRGAQADR
ncbi:MAG: QueT transporter family protein [Fretibacterium sp.]|nr:QueT transporter family protein [Fretibacterium sp.]